MILKKIVTVDVLVVINKKVNVFFVILAKITIFQKKNAIIGKKSKLIIFFIFCKNFKIILRKKIENCRFQIEFSKCLICETGFFSGQNGHCFHVQSSNQVSNCKQYESSSLCSVCENKFYLNIEKNECIPINKPIDNCMEYSPSQKCQQCVFGYFLNSYGTVCYEITKEMSQKKCMFFNR